MRLISFIAGSVLAVSAVVFGGGDRPETLDELMQRAAVIKPSSEELKWQRIPWLTDLAAAQHTARNEKRPILLWVTGDDPLERC